MPVDAEIHFWKYAKNMGPPMVRNNKMLQEDYLPEQIALSLSRNSIDACIAVASEPVEVETRFLAELAATHPILAGVVGWIDLSDTKAIEKIQELSQYPAIRGFQSAAGDVQKLSSAVMTVFSQFQYVFELSLAARTDITLLKKHLDNYPDQYFVLQHCGNPDSKQPPAAEWEMNIRDLAKSKNLFCKVSGLLSSSNAKSWKPADFYPFLDIIFDAFGPDRLLFASNWPFLLVAGMYVQWKSLLEKYTEKYIAEDREKFFGENARRIYRI
jgi:L-fuconolactonase